MNIMIFTIFKIIFIFKSKFGGLNIMKKLKAVSNRIVELINGKVDKMKIQKLLYFAQAEHLVKYDKPLFEEDFEAWEYGPVILSLYEIFYADKIFANVDLNLKPNEEIVIEKIVNKYGNMDSIELSELTHLENSPWDKVFKKYKKVSWFGSSSYYCTQKISKESMKDYYKNNGV